MTSDHSDDALMGT